METIKGLIREIHRRSLWQVLGIFVAASWGVLQVVDLLTETAGLPDWTPTMALVALMLGLPVCLATAFVQEGLPGSHSAGSRDRESALADEAPRENLAAGTGSLDRPTTRPSKTRRLLTWRNSLLGGVGAFAVLGFSLAVYVVMWTTGMGPVGNLVAQGIIVEGERVLLADFADATGEGIGDAVTEALRTDLLQAAILDLVERADIQQTLRLMEVEAGAVLTAERAREVALRQELAAVIEGEVASVGSGYIITATLRAAESGRSVASFRVTADGPDDIISSIDKLSQDLRAKSGESLRTIRAGEPLERVTTSSLEALRLYTEALAVYYEESDGRRSAELVEQALVLDSTFAMGWRMLGIALQGGLDPSRQAEAYANSFRYRDRLQEVERYIVEGSYYTGIDLPRSIEAYENALRIDPDEPRALMNLALIHQDRFDLAAAEALFRRGIDGGRSYLHYLGLTSVQVSMGRLDEAAAVLRDWEEAFPEQNRSADFRFSVSFAQGDLVAAAEHARERSEDLRQPARLRATGMANMGRLAYWAGQLEEARELFLRAEALDAQTGAANEWARRGDTAYEEALVGEPEWARLHIREVLEGAYATLTDADRNQLRMAALLGTIGDAEAVEFLIEDWEETSPAERRGPTTTARVGLALLQARIERGDTAGAEETLQRLLDSSCSEACWPFRRARLHDRLNDHERAVELYERVRRPGYSGWGPNTGERLHAMMRLGPLYEEIGDAEKAIEAYQRIIELWADGDARGQETVRRFRQRIAALRN